VGTVNGQKNNYNDLIFFIRTGYSKQPRKVYRYLINEDSLIKSPKSGIVIDGCSISDINRDSLPEFILNTAATGNHDRSFPFTDSLSWLMVLDNNLQFLFPPVEIGKNPSRVQVLPFQIRNEIFLLVFYDYFGSENSQSSFFIYDLKGNKIKEKPVMDYEPNNAKIFLNRNEKKQSFFFIKNRKGEVVEFDSSFQIISTLKIPQITSVDLIPEIDADFDVKKELIFHGPDKQTLIFVRDNFKHSVIWQYHSDNFLIPFTPFTKTGDNPLIYVQFPDHGSYISYEKNPIYYLRFLLYIAIFIAIYFFVSIIGRLQRYRLNMKKKNELKMVSLQMKAIKNQIDPHFTLNVLNAIGSLYSSENNRENADYIFGKYAKLIRQTVISSDQVIVTIGEELDFVRNYIEIEKFRFGSLFTYYINIDNDSQMDIKIPRMLIHTFVENAIKYSIRNRPEGGVLNICIQTINGVLNIIIEDNGKGLGLQDPSKNGTGKGFTILQELIDLFYRLENVRM